MIREGADLHARGKGGDTALHVAARSGNAEIITALLGAGASLTTKNEHGQSPLLIVATASDQPHAAERQAAIYGPVFDAVEEADISAVRGYLEADADPATQRIDGDTLLHAAVKTGENEVVKALLEARGQVDAQDAQGRTALDVAEAIGEADVIETLRKQTMFAALEEGDDAALEHFLDKGIGANAKDSRGRTPLYVAVLWRNSAAVSRLLDAHADPNIKNDSGSAALISATRTGECEIVARLIEAGADPDVTNSKGDAALHAATDPKPESLEERTKCLQILLDAGAYPSPRGENGYTPLHNAVLALNRIAVEALLKAGAYPLENDNVVSLTPLELLTKYLDHSAGRVEDWTEAGGLIGFGFAAWQMEAMLKQARPIAKMLEVATREVSIIDRINYMLER